MNTAVLGMAPKGRQKRPADVAELDNRQRLQLDAAQSPETVRGGRGEGGRGRVVAAAPKKYHESSQSPEWAAPPFSSHPSPSLSSWTARGMASEAVASPL